jgi:integrase
VPPTRRVSELVHAHAVEFDLDVDRPVWTIPGTREGNKSLDTYIVPLPPVAVDIIKRQLQSRARPSLYVFPARSAIDKPTSRHSPSHDFFDMCTDLGITGVRLHDSRGLIVTHMSAMGIPSEIRSHVLQHSGDMTESLADSTYNAWHFEPEKRRALSLWEARLLAIVDGRPLPADRW